MRIDDLKMINPCRRSLLAAGRLLGTAVIVIGALGAQTGTTLVTGSLSDAMGITSTNKLTATCRISSTATFTAGTGAVVPANAPHLISVSAGIFSAAILPVDGTDAVFHNASWAMRCHVPLQTADGRNCEGNSSLVSQGLCIVGGIDWGPVYLLVPTSVTAVDLATVLRVKKPTGTTWAQLLAAGVTWGHLLTGN